jgi:hypothetical protein
VASLVAVDHDPFGPQLTPVDHDPFGYAAGLQPFLAPPAVPGQDMGQFIRRGAEAIAPNMTSLATGQAAPPIQNVREQGKVPSTSDPRYGGAVPEFGNILSNFVGPGAEAKAGAGAMMAIPAFFRRGLPLAERMEEWMAMQRQMHQGAEAADTEL